MWLRTGTAAALALALGCGSGHGPREASALGPAPFAAEASSSAPSNPRPGPRARAPAAAPGDARPLLIRHLPVVDFAPPLSLDEVPADRAAVAEELVADAAQLHRGGSYVDAEAGYRAALAANAGHLTGRYGLASLYVATGQVERGLALLAELAVAKECADCRALVDQSRWDERWKVQWLDPVYAVVLETAAAHAAPGEPPFVCPAGSQRKGEIKVGQPSELWCETPRGRRHGRFRRTADGVAEDGAFDSGRRHGMWIVDGPEVSERTSYLHGKKHGVELHISNRSGRVVLRRGFDRGRLDGPYKEWYDPEKLPYGPKVEGEYRRGERHRTWRYFDVHGTERVRENYRGGVRHGRFSYWDDAGNLLRSVEMRRGNGDWVAYDVDSRKIEEGRIARGKKIGWWFESELGVAGWREGRYRDGQRVGMWTFFGSSRDRKVAEGRYRDGKRHGGWSYWHDSGVLASAGAFDRDQRDGEWVVFDATGKVAQTLMFRRGRLAAVNGRPATAAMRSYLRQFDVGRGPPVIEVAPP